MNVLNGMLAPRGNMILATIRRINAAILKFVMGIKLRSVGATMLGGFAGLSLTATIIPSALEFVGIMDSFSARWGLGGYAVYSIILWAVGGRAAQKTGDKKLGAIIMGFVGLSSGLLFTALGIGTEITMLLSGGCAALLYGAVGGMIIGDALREPGDPTGPPNTSSMNDVKLFRYFK